MSVHFPEGESHFFIEGPAGKLEVQTLSAKNAHKGVGIICHPHPLFQGTMQNKVVHALSRAFHHKDLHTIRFNFRGVGKSEGHFGDSIGEIEDLMAVLAWSDKVLGKPPLWLAGFSFGSYIAASGAARHECVQLFTVAPAVNHQPYDSLKNIICPWVIIQGEKDEVIPPEVVYEWAHRYPDITLLKLPEASHFFHGNLATLRSLVEENFIYPTPI